MKKYTAEKLVNVGRDIAFFVGGKEIQLTTNYDGQSAGWSSIVSTPANEVDDCISEIKTDGKIK